KMRALGEALRLDMVEDARGQGLGLTSATPAAHRCRSAHQRVRNPAIGERTLSRLATMSSGSPGTARIGKRALENLRQHAAALQQSDFERCLDGNDGFECLFFAGRPMNQDWNWSTRLERACVDLNAIAGAEEQMSRMTLGRNLDRQDAHADQ